MILNSNGVENKDVFPKKVCNAFTERKFRYQKSMKFDQERETFSMCITYSSKDIMVYELHWDTSIDGIHLYSWLTNTDQD